MPWDKTGGDKQPPGRSNFCWGQLSPGRAQLTEKQLCPGRRKAQFGDQLFSPWWHFRVALRPLPNPSPPGLQ